MANVSHLNLAADLAGKPELPRDAEELFCLAALTYRSFEDARLPLPHEERLRAGLVHGLENVPIVQGRWDLVWGPASYRAPFSFFDDAMMYVVRSREPGRRRYVVVIRGTNPISAFDWLLGDFWVTEQLDWPYGDRSGDRGKISLSTALGIAVLRALRSSPVRTDIAARLWRFFDTGVADRVRAAASAAARALGLGDAAALDPALLPIRQDFATLVAALGYAQRAAREVSSSERILRAIETWRSHQRREAVRHAAGVIHNLAADHSLGVLHLLEAMASFPVPLSGMGGIGLVAFLRGAVAEAAGQDLEIMVTGHSKGGALASTAALWLADTQGTENVGPNDAWDPERRASVHCVSFAGPTAGNAAFVAHSDRVLGDRCARVANTLDVVTHAWTVGDLKKIADLYGSDGVDRVPLAELITQIVSDVENLGYGHAGRAYPLHGSVDHTRPLFFEQFVHQHMRGYIDGMKLPKEITELTFLSPFAR